LFWFQREISQATDNAARLYRKRTPESLCSAPEIWDTMNKAQDKLIKTIRSGNFEKFISVAHKDNGKEFFYEVFLFPFILFSWSFLFNFYL